MNEPGVDLSPRPAPPVHGFAPSDNGQGARNGARSTLAKSAALLTHQARRCSARLRVAFLTPTLLMGGAERWMISLARCCDRRLIEWTGTALTERASASPVLCREMAAFMPIYAGPLAGPTTRSPCIHYCSSARRALEAAASGADVLVTWGVKDLAKLTQGMSIPTVFVSHGGGEWSVETLKSSESGAGHFAAVSEAARLPFSVGVRDRVTIIHNGVDVHRCTPGKSRRQTRAAWGFENHHRLVGYVGRYSWEKRPEAAAQTIRCFGGDFRAVYAGEGWAEAHLRQHVREIAGERVRFVPMDPNTGNILHAIDVFMLASAAEGFSLTMAEAWYCGTPVVATPAGAVSELERLHGQLVSRAPIGASAEELADAVQVALTPTYRTGVVARARELVSKHYTAMAMAQRWTQFLLSIR